MKWRSLLHVVFSVCLIVLSLVSVAFAGEPTALVKQTTDKVVDILKNKEMKKPGKTEERRAAIRRTISERFDFEEMAKRSLARYWNQRTPDEKKEFVGLYSDLLERTYIRKIEAYTDEQFIYGEETDEGDYAVVRTKIITKKDVDVPIEYRMEKKNGDWLVYDVVIEGVSLVSNYRNQFNEIMHSGSYETLVKKLKNKQVEGRTEDRKK
jgi:phospholipid transport system substrate-binding protein